MHVGDYVGFQRIRIFICVSFTENNNVFMWTKDLVLLQKNKSAFPPHYNMLGDKFEYTQDFI